MSNAVIAVRTAPQRILSKAPARLFLIAIAALGVMAACDDYQPRHG